MKIACLAASAVPSNTANSIQIMKACQALVQAGQQVQLWVPGSSAAAWRELAEHYGLSEPFAIHWLASPRLLKRYDFTWRAVQQARSWGAELVYTWMVQVAVLAQADHLPVIFEIHDRPTGKFGKRLFRHLIQAPGKKRFLIITEALRHALEQDYQFSFEDREVQIAPNGTDPEVYSNLPEPAEARQQLGLPEKLTAGYTGHFYSGRGTDLLLGLARCFPGVNFLWVGGRSQDVAGWRSRLSDEGLKNITLTGYIDKSRLPLYQAAADVLLMPYERVIAGSSGGNSADICSPMKMFDYLAAGRVIISSDLPVIREVLNERNAVFAAPEDLQDWQQALAGFVADPQKYQRLAVQARLDAAQYSWQGRAVRAMDGFIA
ncbi:MAG: glycosyltransferase [Anaerolineaceae bacterium]|nr:glycosyltransferase [Anaerolineaceae bacterium]